MSTTKQLKLYQYLKNILIILLGNTIYALAVVMFILPNNLITGGTTGLGIFLQDQFGVPLSIFVSSFNIIMFCIGAFVLGRKFALTTLLSTFYYPVILAVMQKIPALSEVSVNPIVALIYAGLMIGVGIGIVIKAGASTGGMDIPPLVLHKKFGIPVSVTLYVIDFSVLILQFLYADTEQVLIGILLVMLYTIILDKVLLIGKSQVQVKIVSKQYEKMNEMIIHKLDRGCTLVHAETGLLHNNTKIVLTVISNRELTKLNQLVTEIDPSAFMIIHQANEVKGRGFTLDRIYAKEDITN